MMTEHDNPSAPRHGMEYADTIDVIVFDLGGVLVELTGVEPLIAWMGNTMTPEELWKTWLESPTVRAFESGQCSADLFARELVAELGLPVAPDELLEHFQAWLSSKFAGADELMAELEPRYTLACFSNTNELHWPVMRDDYGLGRHFRHCFISYEMGRLKPDLDAFRHITEVMETPAERILFLDDNIINVEGAVRAGLRAHRVVGVEGARRRLVELGMLADG